jgi:hypothetical protein
MTGVYKIDVWERGEEEKKKKKWRRRRRRRRRSGGGGGGEEGEEEIEMLNNEGETGLQEVV